MKDFILVPKSETDFARFSWDLFLIKLIFLNVFFHNMKKTRLKNQVNEK